MNKLLTKEHQMNKLLTKEHQMNKFLTIVSAIAMGIILAITLSTAYGDNDTPDGSGFRKNKPDSEKR